jgi:hypothetical protein
MQNNIYIILILVRVARKLAKHNAFTQPVLNLSEVRVVQEMLSSARKELERIRLRNTKIGVFGVSQKIMTFTKPLGNFFTFIIDAEHYVFFLGEVRLQISHHLYDKQQSEEIMNILQEIWHDLYKCQSYSTEAIMYFTNRVLSDTMSFYD